MTSKVIVPPPRGHSLVAATSAVVLLVALLGPAHARSDVFIAPPRTIADITAILDQEKPDPEQIAKMRADADASPPQTTDAASVVDFYYGRGVARQNIGRFRDSIADLKTGIAIGRQHGLDVGYLQQALGFQYNWSGDFQNSLDVFLSLARESNTPSTRGYLFSAYRWISFLLIAQGDLDQAQRYLDKNEALLAEAQAWPNFAQRKYGYRAQIEYSRGRLFEARGRLADAETAYREAELDFTEVLAEPADPRQSARRWSVEVVRDNMIASQAVVKAKQGRYAEAEADVRRALLNRLATVGKYSLTTATLILPRFAAILLDQGRYSEAEKLTRTQIEIFKTLGVTEDSQYFVLALNNLASMQVLQGRWSEAVQIYSDIDNVTASWDVMRKAQLSNIDRVLALYNTGRVSEGLAIAKELVAQSASRFGDQHAYTAYARAAVAAGLSRENHDAEALNAFRQTMPIVLAAARNPQDDDTINAAASEQRTRIIAESYMTLLARNADSDNAGEAFSLADAIRNRSVQTALTLSGARAVAGSPKLAELARREQDTAKRIAAQFELLNDFLARPREQRDDPSIRELQTRIGELRAEHARVRAELGREFPTYADLIDPHPATADLIRGVLKPDEAFISFYFGSQNSFVWAISKDRPPVFAAIGITADDIAAKVKTLRAALEPQAELVSDIPPFDVALAFQLYGFLLKPIEAVWRDAKSLIVATNGALGGLPLGVLPTAPSQIDAQARPLFAGYRQVPWLARSHAVTMIPSASALVTLRHWPSGSPQRDALIGFGDPYFSEQQAAAAEGSPAPIQVASVSENSGDISKRGVALRLRAAPHTEDFDKAQIAMLPRLPDTRQELTSIAQALGADPAKALYLGKDANERNVETTDLSHYRIVAFATHGLIPGDLDGLTQPALALTAPEVAGVTGDGLLTMTKILALKLDADWVVLSACNTAAGAGAGAEAASGLGRAFFYAGTRAGLVTNWSVHSVSALQLVSDVFRRQAADPKLSRAEALRLAMLTLLDRGEIDDAAGQTLFTYAHPLFWAPYTIIGDGD
jgi:CHAT domain-containing protein/tetratricopeptide (TPR) repeat protein